MAENAKPNPFMKKMNPRTWQPSMEKVVDALSGKTAESAPKSKKE